MYRPNPAPKNASASLETNKMITLNLEL